MPRFSIEIPHYDRPTLLRNAVASCISQTYSDFEVLIYDDGTPNSPLLDNILSDLDLLPFVRIYRNDVNGGVASARNFLWDHAESPIHTFLDSDDMMHPLRLERQLRDIENKLITSKKNVLISSTDYSTFLLSNNKLLNKIRYQRDDFCIKQDLYLLQPVAFGSMSIFIRNHFISPFDPLSKACEDYQFLASLIDEAEFFHNRHISSYVSLHSNSLSTNPFTRNEQLAVHDKVIYSLWSKYFAISQKQSLQLRQLFVTQDATFKSTEYFELFKTLDLPKVSLDSLPTELRSMRSWMLSSLKSYIGS
jgi:glycosyltransferase involved in cell wall biosynthesis